ncbi:acyl-CoA dehydrogenase family protein [Enemella sp. A6]|uniref:acyl-CoA dehydrogenase family protein n=1 Tax=Enemella sp. A6 TaxID=3440152 RepID=UPI003EBCEA3F
MTNPVMQAIEERAELFRDCAASNEKLTKLDDRAAQGLRETGVMRMLQPATFGGQEAHPVEFAEAAMEIGKHDASTGWVAGIVGLHSWEVALADPKVQHEIWGEDPEVWIASPYAPLGVLKPVDGGYIFNGHWQFSSGTDHCDWIFLGAFMGDENGQPLMPPQSYHVIMPRSDYEIVEDSWDTVGLRGTGSRDIIVRDAFVPDYRVIDGGKVMDGTLPKEMGVTATTYNVPFTSVFPLGITSAVIGACEGALAAALAYQQGRIQITGTKIKDDPHTLFTISEAAADIQASRTAMLDNINRMYDRVEAGKEITFEERAENRRTQVSACWRAVRAMNEVVVRSGGNGMRVDSPIQRFWRDANMGLVHAIHVQGSVYHVAALTSMDIEPPMGPIRSMI